MLIVVSSSGETDDAVESVRMVKSLKDSADILTVGIVNEAQSTIAAECDVCLSALAGVELGVASTKVFSATALVLLLLAIHLGEQAGVFEEREALLEKLHTLPDLAQEVIDTETSYMRPDLSVVLNRDLRQYSCDRNETAA